jgi:hypothetical protein
LVSRWFEWRVEFRHYAFPVLKFISLFKLPVLINRLAAGIRSDLAQLGEADRNPRHEYNYLSQYPNGLLISK